MTEALSLAHLLAQIPLAISWTIFAGIGALVVFTNFRALERKTCDEPLPADCPTANSTLSADRYSMMEWLWLSSCACALVVTALIAVKSPPTNYDSMTYHLPRIVYWQQNASVGFFPTHNMRQLWMPPFSEYAMAHLLILGGGDRLVNLVQWFSMALSLIVVGLIVRQLGGARSAGFMAAFLCASLPMGILQASSTQNDLAVGYWLLCLVYFTLRTFASHHLKDWLFVGVSLALSIGTKGTAILYAFPFLACAFIAMIGARKASLRNILAGVSLVSCIVVALNGPQWLRNYQIYKHPLGDTAVMAALNNASISSDIMVSNVVRNGAQAATVGIPWLDTWVLAWAQGVHRWLNLDIDDPRGSFLDLKFHLAVTKDESYVYRSEDTASYGFHAVLFLIVGAMAVVRGKIWRLRRATLIGCLTFTAFALFSLLLRWQPWHNRLLLPLFMIACVPAAFAFARRPYANVVITILLISSAKPCLFDSVRKPLNGSGNILRVPRDDQQVAMLAPLYRTAAVNAIHWLKGNHLSHVGWVGGSDECEYPLWCLFTCFDTHNYRFEPVAVNNESHEEPMRAGAPAAILVSPPGRISSNRIELRDHSYRKIWNEDTIAIFVDEGIQLAGEGIEAISPGLYQ